MVYPDWLAEAAIAVVGTVMFLGYLGLGAWLAPKILRLFTTEKAQEFKEAKQGTWRDAVMGAIFVFWPLAGLLGCVVWVIRYVLAHDQPVPDPNSPLWAAPSADPGDSDTTSGNS